MMHRLSSVHSMLFHSHFSHILTYSHIHTSNILISLLEIFSLILDLFLMSLPSICALLTIRSFTNPLHYTAIADLADSHNIHIFALIKTNSTSSQLFDAISRGFTVINTPRPVPDSCASSIVGGSTAFLLRESGKLLSTPTATLKSFDLSSVTIKLT